MNAFLTMDEQELERQRAEVAVSNQQMIAGAEALVIETAEQCEGAVTMLGEVKARINALEKRRKETKEPALEAGRRIDQLFKELKEPVEALEKRLKDGILGYRRAEQKVIEEANAKAEAERKAEEERQRAEQRAAEEKARAEREEADRIAAEKAQEVADGDHSQEQAMMQAQEAAQAAAMQERIAAEQRPVVTTSAAPVEQASTMRAGGATVSAKKKWKFRVTDPSKVPSAFKKVDEVALRQAVKDGVREIPGVEIYEDEDLAVRAA